MTELRKRMLQDMQLRNFSPRTIEAYTSHVARFAKHFGKAPDLLGPEHIREYQLHLVQQNASWSNFNQAVCSLRFFYNVTLHKGWPVDHIPYGKRPKRLPTVLSPEEAQRLLACAAPLKLRMVLTTAYACGLRVSEAVNLRPQDIDSQRMQLWVRQGKGKKDRLVPLSAKLLNELREYWRKARPENWTWLFPGALGHKPIAQSSVQQAIKRAAKKAEISKRVSPHTLRHSYATHLLEAGVDLVRLQALLGHSCLSTTMVYLHVRSTHLAKVVSPLDLLPPLDSPTPTPTPPTPTSPAPNGPAGKSPT